MALRQETVTAITPTLHEKYRGEGVPPLATEDFDDVVCTSGIPIT